MAFIRHRAADGFTVLAQQEWPTIASDVVEVISTPLKFTVENIATRVLGLAPFGGLSLLLQQVGTNDGINFFETAAETVLTLSKPWGAAVDSGGNPTGAPTAVDDSAGGVWASTGQRGVVVAATNATGETIASVEIVFNVSNTARRWRYDWAQVPGATGYKVYRTDTPGTYSGNNLRATIGSGATLFFIDDGAATTAGTPRTDNTSGGVGPAYGTVPPTGNFNGTTKTIATAAGGGLKVGQQWFFWARLRVPAGTSEVGNKRVVRVLPKEI